MKSARCLRSAGRKDSALHAKVAIPRSGPEFGAGDGRPPFAADARSRGRRGQGSHAAMFSATFPLPVRLDFGGVQSGLNLMRELIKHGIHERRVFAFCHQSQHRLGS